MDQPDTHALGYRDVDEDPNLPVLLENMDTTGTWAATAELRAWERDQLQLVAGERLLDVGCGHGDAALDLARELGADGELVGIDASAAMVDSARARAQGAACRARFAVGDALALDEPAGSFDAARSERVLQWLSDPGAAVAELVRVVRRGGRLCLIDTDWSTFRLVVGDPGLEARVRAALREERRRPSNVGRRLADLVREAGGTVVAEHEAVQLWRAWDPDVTPAPAGCFSMRSLAEDLAEAGQLGEAEIGAFVDQVHEAARQGRFRMELTMHAVLATVPGPRSA